MSGFYVHLTPEMLDHLRKHATKWQRGHSRLEAKAILEFLDSLPHLHLTEYGLSSRPDDDRSDLPADVVERNVAAKIEAHEHITLSDTGGRSLTDAEVEHNKALQLESAEHWKRQREEQERARAEQPTRWGVTHFYSETGTEGGYWAFQDEAHVKLEPPSYGVFARTRVWDAHDPERSGVVKSITDLKGKSVVSIRRGQVVLARVDWNDGESEDDVPVPSDRLLVERWSYEGLSVLRDGDYLVIYDTDPRERADSEVLWEGEIDLRRFDLFTEDARGMWIHAEQTGEDRDEWADLFFGDGRPAKLTFREGRAGAPGRGEWQGEHPRMSPEMAERLSDETE